MFYVELIIQGAPSSELSIEVSARSANLAAQTAHSLWMSAGRLPPVGTWYSIRVYGEMGEKIREFNRRDTAAATAKRK